MNGYEVPWQGSVFQPSLWEVAISINRTYREGGHASYFVFASREHAFVLPAHLFSVHFADLQP